MCGSLQSHIKGISGGMPKSIQMGYFDLSAIDWETFLRKMQQWQVLHSKVNGGRPRKDQIDLALFHYQRVLLPANQTST